MARIEAGTTSEREALKNEIKAEIRQEERRKKRRHCLGCAVLWLIVLAVPAFLIGSLLAKTGLVTVPVLTGRYYRPSEPTRKVLPLAGSKSDDIMRSIAAGVRIDPRAGTADFVLREAQLTTLVAEGLASSGGGLPFPLTEPQVAILPDGLEFFATTPQDGRAVTLKVLIRPVAAAGALQFEVVRLQLGAYDLPDAFGRLASTLATNLVGDAVVRAVSQLGELKAVKLEDGLLRLSVRPAGL